MKKQLKIRMKKTLAPHEIPNGTEGVLYKKGDKTMIQIKMKCRKCGKPIDFSIQGSDHFNITIIPHECDNCELNRKMDLLKKSVCGVCDKPISNHEFGFIGQIIIHQSCYPGGKSAYLSDCRKENMPKI